jgi:hypothetical protein
VTDDIVTRLRRWTIATDAVPASDLMDEAADEIERLRDAIRRLADQDATLSVCNGDVTVTMDATLTDEERRAVGHFAREFKGKNSATIRSLLERTSETNHDAAPAATAPSSDREDDPSSQRGTGNTQEPAAWWFKCDEYESVTLLKEHADAMAEPYRTTPVPLYRSPALTDEEREAICQAVGAYYDNDDDEECARIAATLHSLLKRLG